MHPANKGVIQLSGFLVLLLILVLVSFFELIPGEKKREHCLPIIFWNYSRSSSREIALQNSYKEIRDIRLIRAYQTLHLSSHSKMNQAVLRDFRIKVHALMISKDTTEGIHLAIDDKTSWQDCIHAFDICLEEKIHTFCPAENDIWLFYPRKQNDLFVLKPENERPRLMHFE